MQWFFIIDISQDLKVEVARLTGSLNMANDTRQSLEANRAKEEQCDEELNRVEEQIARCQDKVIVFLCVVS